MNCTGTLCFLTNRSSEYVFELETRVIVLIVFVPCDFAEEVGGLQYGCLPYREEMRGYCGRSRAFAHENEHLVNKYSN